MTWSCNSYHAHAEVLKLLAGYAAPLFNEITLATPEFRRTAVNHLLDLVALALGATHDAAGLATNVACLPRGSKWQNHLSSRTATREIFPLVPLRRISA